MEVTVESFRELYDLSKDGEFSDRCSFHPSFKKWLDEGNIEELAKSLIRAYQQRCSEPLNRALRQENGTPRASLIYRARLLDAVLETLPSFPEGVLWRRDSPHESLLRWASDNIGQVIQVPSFWGSYSDTEKWKGSDPAFKILSSSRSRGKSISEYTNFQLSEGEVLFMTNTKFKVLAVEEYITLEETEENATATAFDGYYVSQNDADHDPTIRPSLND